MSERLHYLDWLRVLAILGVFLFHAVHPFDVTDWHIKNGDQSLLVTLIFVIFLYPGVCRYFSCSPELAAGSPCGKEVGGNLRASASCACLYHF